MKLLQKLNRDTLLEVKLMVVGHRHEYVLCSAKDSDKHYAILTDDEVQE